MNTRNFLAIATLAALSAVSAHADEADGSQHPITITSTRAAADVRAEAMNPVRITNGGTGYIGLANSAVSAQDVKAQAIQAARSGQITKGEAGGM
jgi:hypothetical protein